jgi:hypothetical protein
MTVEYHLCPPADEAVTLPDDITKTDNIVRVEEEQSLAPPDTHATCPNTTKWADLITTESDADRDRDKQGKKREKSKRTKDDKQEDKESDDNTTDAGTPRLTQTTSPKRSKKIKVDRDILTARERTRSQSRLKSPVNLNSTTANQASYASKYAIHIQNRNSKH